MKKLDVKQGSQKWLSLRKKYVGSSDAPSIMGIGFKTPYQLWQEKMGLTESIQNEAMKRGLNLEPIARQKFIEEVGYNILPTVALHDSIEFMLVSFDGLSESGEVVVEIKCPGKEDHEMAMDGIIPEKYVPQLQHQMEVANVKSMFYFSYTEKSYKVLEIERNDRYIKDIIGKEREFWDCMQNLEAPELIDKDFKKRNDDKWNKAATEYIQILKLEDRKEELRKLLIEMAGNENTMGGGVKLSKITRKGNVDYKLVPQLIGVNLKNYRKPAIEIYRIGVC